mgnify:CR=1 FL=1
MSAHEKLISEAKDLMAARKSISAIEHDDVNYDPLCTDKFLQDSDKLMTILQTKAGEFVDKLGTPDDDGANLIHNNSNDERSSASSQSDSLATTPEYVSSEEEVSPDYPVIDKDAEKELVKVEVAEKQLEKEVRLETQELLDSGNFDGKEGISETGMQVIEVIREIKCV